MKKKIGAQIWVKGTKIRPETSFFAIFSKFGSLVFLEEAYNSSLRQFQISSRGKKFLGTKFGPNLPQKLGFLPFS